MVDVITSRLTGHSTPFDSIKKKETMYAVVLMFQHRIRTVKLCETFDLAMVEAIDLIDVEHITNLEELLRKHHRAYSVYESVHIEKVTT